LIPEPKSEGLEAWLKKFSMEDNGELSTVSEMGKNGSKLLMRANIYTIFLQKN